MRPDIPTAKTGLGRFTAWLVKEYPRYTPARGHNYLIALCGHDDYAAG